MNHARDLATLRRRAVALLFIGMVSGLFAIAQTGKQNSPAQLPASPQVHSDRRVTFRFPNVGAATVQLNLDGHEEPLPLERNGTGTWSITVGPLAPEIYNYNFVADGVSLLDPSNTRSNPNLRWPSNYFEVSGPEPEMWDVQEVPHGVVHHHFYTSKIAGDQRDFYVYTPPDYDPKAHKKYPVLYLLHGYSDDASAWTAVGRANIILDNLIAQHKAKPMIVVMPLGYGVMQYVTGDRANYGSGLREKSIEIFTQSLLEEVIPQVQSQYRVSDNRKDRAIAGLSMGGAESLWVGLHNIDDFAWIGAFSAGGLDKDFDQGFPSLTAKSASPLKLLWIACGQDDRHVTRTPLITLNRQRVAWLRSKNIPVTFVETPGMHQWQVWRDNLIHFAPLLFQSK